MVQIKRSRFQALDGREAGRCGYDEAGGGAAVSRSMNACAWTTIAPGSSPASSRSNMSVAFFAISMTGWRIVVRRGHTTRSEEHTSELQSLMRNSSAVFCFHNKNKHTYNTHS